MSNRPEHIDLKKHIVSVREFLKESYKAGREKASSLYERFSKTGVGKALVSLIGRKKDLEIDKPLNFRDVKNENSGGALASEILATKNKYGSYDKSLPATPSVVAADVTVNPKVDDTAQRLERWAGILSDKNLSADQRAQSIITLSGQSFINDKTIKEFSTKLNGRVKPDLHRSIMRDLNAEYKKRQAE